jgi:hypothetical protein
MLSRLKLRKEKEYVIRSDEVGRALCGLLGIDPCHVGGITVNLEPSGPVRLIVTVFGREDLLDFDWKAALEGAEVTVRVVERTDESVTMDDWH